MDSVNKLDSEKVQEPSIIQNCFVRSYVFFFKFTILHWCHLFGSLSMQMWRKSFSTFMFCFFTFSSKKNVEIHRCCPPFRLLAFTKSNKQPGLVPSAGLPSHHRKPPRRSFPTHPTHPATFPASSMRLNDERSFLFPKKDIRLRLSPPREVCPFMTTIIYSRGRLLVINPNRVNLAASVLCLSAWNWLKHVLLISSLLYTSI